MIVARQHQLRVLSVALVVTVAADYDDRLTTVNNLEVSRKKAV